MYLESEKDLTKVISLAAIEFLGTVGKCCQRQNEWESFDLVGLSTIKRQRSHFK
jgi:hypothetical protein